jgi:tetrahydrodipicolinate N-succinyltransferase
MMSVNRHIYKVKQLLQLQWKRIVGLGIGANVVITAGVTIGKHSVVSGGAVVTKDSPPFSVAVETLQKLLKSIILKRRIGENLIFSNF